MNIKALRQKQADLLAEADQLFAAFDKESRAMTDAERTRDDEISSELLAIGSDIERAERQMSRQRALDMGQKPVDPNAIADAANAAARQEQGGGFASFGSQLLAIAKAGTAAKHGRQLEDARLQWFDGISGAASGMNETVGADGGFLVQTEHNNEMLQNMFTSGEILSRVRRIPIGANANGLTMNGVDETSRVNGSRWGGVQVYWTAEAGLLTSSAPKFRRIKMELDKITGLFYATTELLADATALEAWVKTAFEEEIGFKAEDAMMQGVGTGMPLGWLNSGAVITVTKETSQVAATIVAENILKMWARMPARSRKNAVWYVNQDIEPQLYQMNVKIKNVAGSENVGGITTPQVIFTPAGDNGNQYATLMGRPVIPVEYAATLGTAGDIQLVDPSQYLMIDKGAAQSASSIHVRFLYDETAFRIIYRANGQPIPASAITPYKGSNTQSPFIILQTR